MEPLFSIITVTFNAAAVIGPTLESVARQQCDDFEYLVIDGASTDDTVARVNAAAIAGTRVLSEKDRGLYDAMNKGIGLARGRYLIFLNAGDAFAAPNALPRLKEAAKDAPGLSMGKPTWSMRAGWWWGRATSRPPKCSRPPASSAECWCATRPSWRVATSCRNMIYNTVSAPTMTGV